MQISSHNTLPVTTGIRPDTSLRQAVAKPRTQTPPQSQAEVVNNTVSDQRSRRPPVFVQSRMDTKLSRTGEEAMRTYRDVATAGNEAELVNRVNVVA
jgi:hypothetical protein